MYRNPNERTLESNFENITLEQLVYNVEGYSEVQIDQRKQHFLRQACVLLIDRAVVMSVRKTGTNERYFLVEG